MSKISVIFSKIAPLLKQACLLIFLLALALYSVVQWHPSFKDPDSFYHAQMTRLTAESGPVADFPWLPFTILGETFADHHFLYHWLLMPFTWLFGELAGLKVAAAVLGALAVTAFYATGRALRLRPGLVITGTLILATAMNFMFRMNLAKAASLSVLLLLLGLAALARREWWALFILGWVYVWAHGSWPLLLFMATVFALIDWWRAREWLAFACPIAGVMLGFIFGLIFNPFFPENLLFYWYQTVHAALLTYDGIVNVGVEWQSYTPLSMFRANGTIFVVLAVAAATAFVAALWHKRIVRTVSDADDRTRVLWALGIIAAAFFFMTLKSQRHIEFFAPVAVLWSLAVIDYVSRRYDLRRLYRLAFVQHRLLFMACVVFVSGAFVVMGARDAYIVTKSFHNPDTTFAWGEYAAAAEWLEVNVPPGQVIYHASWAEFPQLFYRAPQYRYVAGLDPTFLYLKDPAAFVAWRESAAGRVRDMSAAVGHYDAQFVIVSRGEKNLRQAVRLDSSFKLVYADKEVEIYQRL